MANATLRTIALVIWHLGLQPKINTSWYSKATKEVNEHNRDET